VTTDDNWYHHLSSHYAPTPKYFMRGCKQRQYFVGSTTSGFNHPGGGDEQMDKQEDDDLHAECVTPVIGLLSGIPPIDHH